MLKRLPLAVGLLAAITLPAAAQPGQPILVENRPGAASTIGTPFVAEQRPDGTTLLFTAKAPITAAPHVMTLRYSLHQREPLFVVGHVGFTLCVRQDRPTQDAGALSARPD